VILRTTRAVVLTVALLSASAPAVALAQRAPSADQQRARFAAAQRLHDDRRYEEALAAFRALAEETGSPNAHLYVARSLRELGRLTEAHDAMQIALREATNRASAETKYAASRDAAASELAVLALKVAHVVVAIADAPEGSKVALDGTTLAPERVGSPITVDPGDHTVELTPPGAPSVRRTVNVAPGETKTIALSAAADAPPVAPPPPAPPPSPPPVSESSSGGGVRIAGLVIGGLGVASLGAGVVTGLLSNAELSSLEEDCGPQQRCTDPSAADTIDSGKTLETVANITLIGGAVLVAAAIPMVIFGGPSEATSTAIVMSPDGGRLRFSGNF
jgi:hypothetical protein